MKWSWKIGAIAGINVRIHATFLPLLGWVAMSYWLAGHGMNVVLAAVSFIVALFGCVLLHELGHAMAAKQFGIQTADITLLPIGGVARLERIPDEPRKELWIALAGPAVNVAIAVVLYFWIALTHQWEPLARLRVAAGPMIERLLVANVWLVLFNLIPAFPMDGGRILRALLASRMSHPKATRVAALTGQGLAMAFAFIGFFGYPMLIFVGLFVWIGASQEASMAQTREILSGMPVRAAMITEFGILEAADTLGQAVQLTLGGWQHDFPVIDRGRPIGILTRANLLVGLSAYGPEYPVTAVMHWEFPSAQADEMLETAFQRLRESGSNTMPVVSRGRVIGLVTMENMMEYFLIDAALQKRPKSHGLRGRVFEPEYADRGGAGKSRPGRR